MREFVVSEAPLGRVATLARATIEEAGGVVAQHTETTTEFDHLQEDDDDWSRSGYVGTYKRYREDPVQLRIRVWASWPRRLFHGAVWLGLVEAVLFFTLSIVQVPPPPNAWIVSAILTFAFLGLAFLLYATSWADSADLEDEIARKLTARLRDDEEVDGDVYTVGEWEEHRQDVIEQAVAEAERKAPERPSKAREIAGSVAQAGKGKAGALLQRVRADDDDEDGEGEEHPPEDDGPDPEEEPGEADEEDVDPELAAKRERLEELKRKKQEEEDDEGGFLDRIPFLGSSDEDDAGDEPTDEPEDEPAKADEPEPEDEGGEEDGGLLDKVPFLGSSDDEDDGDEPPDEPEQEAAQADEPEEDEDDGSSFTDRLPFLGSSDEPDEDPGDATGGEAEAESEPEPTASDEADADGDASTEETDAPEPEPAADGDAEAEETEPPATGDDEER